MSVHSEVAPLIGQVGSDAKVYSGRVPELGPV
jgi:hypothetical protein